MGFSVVFRFENVYDVCIFVGSIWMGLVFVFIVGGFFGNGRRIFMGGILGMIVGGVIFGYFKIFLV